MLNFWTSLPCFSGSEIYIIFRLLYPLYTGYFAPWQEIFEKLTNFIFSKTQQTNERWDWRSFSCMLLIFMNPEHLNNSLTRIREEETVEQRGLPSDITRNHLSTTSLIVVTTNLSSTVVQSITGYSEAYWTSFNQFFMNTWLMKTLVAFVNVLSQERVFQRAENGL